MENTITQQRIESCTKWLLNLPRNCKTDFMAENRELIEFCVENIHKSKSKMFYVFEKMNVVKRNY